MQQITKKNKYGIPPGLDKLDKESYLNSLKTHEEHIKTSKQKLNVCLSEIKRISEAKEKSYQDFICRKDNVNTLNADINSLLSEKNSILSQLDGASREIPKTVEVSATSKPTEFRSQQSIDAEIAQLEKKFSSATMTLKEEKSFIEMIEALKQKKNDVLNSTKINTKTETPKQKNDDHENVSLKVRLNEIEKSIQAIRLDRSKALQDMNGKSSHEDFKGQLSKLYEERNSLKQAIKSHIDEKNRLMDEWNKKVVTYNASVAEHQAKKMEQARKDRLERNKEMKKASIQTALESAMELPSNDSLRILEQLSSYLTKIKEESQDALKQNAVDRKESSVDVEVPEGKKISTKKEKQLRHDLLTLGFFRELGISPPLKRDDIAKCLIEVNTLYVEEKQKFDKLKEKNTMQAQKLQQELNALGSAI